MFYVRLRERQENIRGEFLVFSYLICGKAEETMEHVLCNCRAARDTWSVCCWKLQKCSEMYDEFILFVDIIRKKLDKDELEAMAVVTRSSWLRRNFVLGRGGGGGGGGGGWQGRVFDHPFKPFKNIQMHKPSIILRKMKK
jgi:hypothetical protein